MTAEMREYNQNAGMQGRRKYMDGGAAEKLNVQNVRYSVSTDSLT